MTEAVTEAEQPRHFHPSWPAYHRRLLLRFVWLGPLLVLALLIASWPSIGLAVIGIGGGLLVAGIGLAVYFARARVTVTDGELRIRGALRTRHWRAGSIGTLVLLPLPGTRRPSLYGVSPVLERMFSLSAELWEADDLEAIAEAIGAPVVHAPAGLPITDIAARYPGTVGWTATRPWLMLLLIMGGTVLALFVIAVIATAVLVATGQVPMPVPTPSPTGG